MLFITPHGVLLVLDRSLAHSENPVVVEVPFECEEAGDYSGDNDKEGRAGEQEAKHGMGRSWACPAPEMFCPREVCGTQLKQGQQTWNHGDLSEVR